MLRRMCENFLPLTLAIAITMAVTAYEFIGQTRIYRGDQQALDRDTIYDSLAQKPDTALTHDHENRLDTLEVIWLHDKAAGSEITTGRPIGFFASPWLGADVDLLAPADSDLIAKAYSDSMDGVVRGDIRDTTLAVLVDTIIGAAAWTTKAHVGFKVMPWVYNDDLLTPIDSELVTRAYIEARFNDHSVSIGQTYGDYIQDSLGAVLDSALTDLVDTGGEIFIQGGTYYLNATDSVQLTGTDTVAKHIYIIGEPGRTIINVTCNAGSKYAFVSTAARALQKLHFRDIEFVGDANSYGVFKEAGGEADSCSFENCIIRDFSNNSATIFSLAGPAHWVVKDCDFIGNRTQYFYLINSDIIDCRFIKSETHGFITATGGSRINIRGCVVDSFGVSSAGMWVDSPYSLVMGNTVNRPDSAGASYGIYLASSSDYSSVQNNRIGNVALGKVQIQAGIYCIGAFCLMTGNYIYGARLAGIRMLSAGDNSFASFNRLMNCVTGIEFDATCSNAGHSENVFDDVGTNVTDNGTGTVNGTTRDLD